MSGLRAFVEELFRAGIREAVICPGSRSTPVALALAAHHGIASRVLIDERSAAYFALGMAKTARRPVALLATSGTAVVNFAPAIVEGNLARVPLVVLTADRPEELQDRGAPQTIDQDHLYGRHARWFARLDLEAAPVEHVRSVAGRAVATAVASPAGPVHLNLPFREPLIPAGPLGALEALGALEPLDEAPAPFTAAVEGRRSLDEKQLDELADRLTRTERGLIVTGPMDEPAAIEPISRVAAATGFPILADPLSGCRCGRHDRSLVLSHADHLVRPGPWIDTHRPELVLRFGAMPTSKPIAEMLCRAEPELIVIDGGGGWRESALRPATFVHADAGLTAGGLADRLGRGPTGWTRDWLAAEVAAELALTEWLAELQEPFEGAPWRVLAEAAPDGTIVWAGSSMPVRDMDAWLPSTERAIRPLSNRGANGIDGVTSSALGAAAASDDPVVLVTGDLSFLHDAGALISARLQPANLLVILVNNDGGGIFSFLPQARTDAPEVGLPGRFEQLFGTPHGIDVGAVVRAFGFEHRLAGSSDLAAAIAEGIEKPGLSIVELRTDRARNAELHKQAAGAVAAALAGIEVRP